MNEPKRQHLVPRVYLKHFALKRNKGWFIDACSIKENESKIFNASIEKVCVKKEFYTFRKLPDEHKRFLERFYSNTVESDYTEIYDVLANPRVIKISDDMRFKIMSFIICQHSRTAHFTNKFNGFWNRVLEQGHSMIDPEAVEKRIYLGENNDEYIDFENKTLAEVQRESDEENREHINLRNYQMFRDLTLRRINDGIAVYKIHPKFKFITSDNPVVAGHLIFDPSIFIKVPIDSHHIVAIVPFHNEVLFDNKTINRQILDEERSYFEYTTNNMVQMEQCENHVLGHKDALEKAIKQSHELDPEQFENEALEYTKKLTDQLQLLQQLKGIKT
jgi:hypothetical protein